jgi:hypothetical protein
VQAFDHAWAEVSKARTSGLEEITEPLERVETFIRNFVDRRPGLPGGCPLLNTAIEADDGNRALRTLGAPSAARVVRAVDRAAEPGAQQWSAES